MSGLELLDCSLGKKEMVEWALSHPGAVVTGKVIEEEFILIHCHPAGL